MTHTLRRARIGLVALAVLVAGCSSDQGTTSLSDPVLAPALGADDIEAAGPDEATDPETATDPEAEAPTDGGAEEEPGGFVLDLSEADLPEVTGPPPGDDEGALPAAGVDLTIAQRSVDAVTSQSHRFSGWFTMTFSGGGQSMVIAPTEPIVVGESSGTRVHSTTDLGPMFDALFSQDPAGAGAFADLLSGDLTIESITDGTTLYLRAPVFAAFGPLAAAGGLPPELTGLDDQWGVIDLAELPGVDAADIAGAAGAVGGGSPAELLELVRSMADVEEVGTADVDGVEATHLRAVVPFDEALAAQGMSADELGAGMDELGELFGDGIPVDLYVDGDGDLVRFVVSIDATGLDGGPAGDMSFSVTTRIDFSDHGAAIDVPVPTGDLVDLTDSLGDLFG